MIPRDDGRWEKKLVQCMKRGGAILTANEHKLSPAQLSRTMAVTMPKASSRRAPSMLAEGLTSWRAGPNAPEPSSACSHPRGEAAPCDRQRAGSAGGRCGGGRAGRSPLHSQLSALEASDARPPPLHCALHALPSPLRCSQILGLLLERARITLTPRQFKRIEDFAIGMQTLVLHHLLYRLPTFSGLPEERKWIIHQCNMWVALSDFCGGCLICRAGTPTRKDCWSAWTFTVR